MQPHSTSSRPYEKISNLLFQEIISILDGFWESRNEEALITKPDKPMMKQPFIVSLLFFRPMTFFVVKQLTQG